MSENIRNAYQKYIRLLRKKKNEILKYENVAVNDNERLRILRSIFSKPITYFTLKTNRRFLTANKKFDYTPARDYVLNSQWL